MTHKKVGGLHFLRFGRLSLSFCICKAPRLSPDEYAANGLLVILFAACAYCALGV